VLAHGPPPFLVFAEGRGRPAYLSLETQNFVGYFQQLHAKNVAAVVDGKPGQQKPTLVILGGGAASGKSAVTTQTLTDLPRGCCAGSRPPLRAPHRICATQGTRPLQRGASRCARSRACRQCNESLCDGKHRAGSADSQLGHGVGNVSLSSGTKLGPYEIQSPLEPSRCRTCP